MTIINLVFVILMIHHIHGLDVVQNEIIDGKVYTINMEKTSQSDAVKSCKNSGGKLYEPKDAITYSHPSPNTVFHSTDSHSTDF